MTELAQPTAHPFFVDGKRFTTDKQNLTGQEIKTIAGVAGNYQLYLEEEGDTPDRAISDGETVPMDHREKHFFAVPPATFGKS
ncbi:MAG: multiubiquitin domain-containing protein [Acidobacteriaceae bacterium]